MNEQSEPTVAEAPSGDRWNDAAWRGVNSLLDRYAEVRAGDSVVIAYTSDSRESAAWVGVALRRRGIETTSIWMAPLRDDGFGARLSGALPDPATLAGRVFVMTFERSTMSHTTAIRDAVAHYTDGSCVVIRAISACADLFAQSLRVEPAELSARNTTLLERCRGAEKLRIEAVGGTRLTIKLDSERYHWISNRAVRRPGRFVILPAGEVATYPASVDGLLVGDYAFNINTIVERDSRLDRSPVSIWIEEGRAVRHQCDDEDVQEFFSDCFEKHEEGRRVGELGFGTNLGIRTPVALNSHINERKPGLHLGFGQHNQPLQVVPYWCDIHLDVVARGGLVWIDDDPVPLDLEQITPSDRPHPEQFYDEDVFSPDDEPADGDCCGLITSERMHNSLARGCS